MKGRKVLLLPNTTTNDLTDNENLITSSIILLTNLLTGMEVESVVLSDKLQYDIIVAMFEAPDYVGKGTEIVIFNWDGLNGAFWYDNYFDENGVENNLTQFDNIKKINYVSIVIK